MSAHPQNPWRLDPSDPDSPSVPQDAADIPRSDIMEVVPPVHGSNSELDDYLQAFSRNIGWVTEAEQLELRGRRVAIAGLGGVGGVHLITLARLGIGGFHIADMDTYELANINRQAGAAHSTLGQTKVDVMTRQALDINPSLHMETFPEGIHEQNMDAFLEGVDLYVDSLDFFALPARRQVFAACHARGIPAVTAAPLGMGTAFLTFMPGQMSFEQYFGLEGRPEAEQYLRFLLGLAPRMLQHGYLVDPSRVDLAARKGPSTPMACQLCAGVAGVESLKILLGRGKVLAAPHGLHFDAYRNRFVKTWRPLGHRNPMSKLMLMIAKRRIADQVYGKDEQAVDTAQTAPAVESTTPLMDRVLDVARWAPSGDNAQPWRFEVHSDTHLTLHPALRVDTGIYDQRGHAHQVTMGVMLETLRIAASGFGLHMTDKLLQPAMDEPGVTVPSFDIHFEADDSVQEDPLFSFIQTRVTQRRSMTTRELPMHAKLELEAAVGRGFSVQWFDTPRLRKQMARVNYAFAKLRLTQEQCYQVHQRVIEWGAQTSQDRLPDQALGLDKPTVRMMRWLMKDWRRVAFMNKWLAGTVLPRMQLEFWPGTHCAAHFALVADRTPVSAAERVDAGRAFQRFWLTAAKHNALIQPGFTPILFGGYIRDGYDFIDNPDAVQLAKRCTERFDKVMGGSDKGARVVALGRIGFGARPESRSVRLPVEHLKNS